MKQPSLSSSVSPPCSPLLPSPEHMLLSLQTVDTAQFPYFSASAWDVEALCF